MLERIARSGQRLLSGAALVLLGACGGSGSGGGGSSPPPSQPSPPPPPAPPPPPLSVGPAACIDDMAGDFSCSGVSLHKRVPLSAMGGTAGNDLWGWVDPATNAEYALMGMNNGTAFVDITDPENPVVIGRLPTQTVASAWRDIKVYQDHAYIVADGAGAHGMQVFDLTRLRDAIPPQTFIADHVHTGFGSAHNIAINEDSGFAYAVGSSTCHHGLIMMDLSTPNNPLFMGCHAESPTHDTQCVMYHGPDLVHLSREICFSSNEDHVAIVDVTDKADPVTLSIVTYPQLGFVHQGWLTEDHRYFLLGDEFDELAFGVPTRTHVFDVSELDDPVYLYAFESATAAIDHNLYIVGNRVFQANYAAGLRVLEFGDLSNREIEEVAFFDTYPASDAPVVTGAWSAYPFFPSGNVVVSDMQGGLFILRLDPASQ
ncbi:MAG: choice-of-anchor B family protein [Gammaproteobacteria bacterium]